MLETRAGDFQTFCIRTALEDVYIDITHAPTFHFQTGRLIQIDCARSNESGPIIVDYVFLSCIDDAEARPEREAGPIGRGTHHAATGQTSAQCVATPASFAMSVSRRPHFLHVTSANSGN